jgi:hypothetical protein
MKFGEPSESEALERSSRRPTAARVAEPLDTSTGVLYEVIVELRNIAAAVDRVSEMSRSTPDVLAASRAIHSALVLLSEWSGSRDTEVQMASADVSMWLSRGDRSARKEGRS